MCGRFVQASPPEDLARYFDAVVVPEAVGRPSWNVAPTRAVETVVAEPSVRAAGAQPPPHPHRGDTERLLTAMRWGLVPFWADDPRIGNRLINARAETVATKPAFRRAFARRRCIVPMDGFYEWQRVEGRTRKQPWYITRRDGEPLAVAGIWERWRPREDDGGDLSAGEDLITCAVITTDANGVVRPIHDRMPALLPPDAWERWLSPEVSDVEALRPLLGPAPDELLVAWPVSTRVNRVGNDGPGLVEPVPAGA